MDDEQIYQQIELGLTTSILTRKDEFELFEPEDFDQSEGNFYSNDKPGKSRAPNFPRKN